MAARDQQPAWTAISRALIAICAIAIAARGARAETKVYQTAQVQLDIRNDWKIDTANNILLVTDPGKNLILVIEVLDAAALDQAIKDADAIIKKYVSRVTWRKRPTSRNLNGMKALAFTGGGLLKGNRVDIAALVVTTPAHKQMLIFGFLASEQSAALQPQVDALVDSIRPARDEPVRPPRPQPSPSTPQPSPPPQRQPPTLDDEGMPRATGFSVQYVPPTTPQLQPLMAFARKLGLEPFVDELNQAVVLPRLVPIQVRECGVANAFYAEYLHAVRVCYELLAEAYGSLRSTAASDAAALELAAGVIKFTLIHELTHALIGELDIPIGGKEEDAADDFAALLLTFEKDDAGFHAATAAARFFEALGKNQLKTGEIAWYDEHSFGLQRTNAILCLLYGADQARYRRLVKDDMGPPQSYLDHQCKVRYPQVRKTWVKLLQAHLRS